MNGDNLIKNATGIEIAKSRHLFAGGMEKIFNIKNIKNINEDFANVKVKNNYYDFFICNSTLQYLNTRVARDLFKYIKSSLNKNGMLIMDIPNYQIYIDKLRIIDIHEKEIFPISNPFNYGIYEIKHNSLEKDFTSILQNIMIIIII